MDEFKDSIDGIIEGISVLKNLYDSIRVVDPFHKKVITYRENKAYISQNSCYNFWKKKSYCQNCVSARAFNEKDTFVKIEYNKERIFMVIASPVTIKGKEYVIETFKDITSTGVISDLEKKSVKEINEEIKRMNEGIIKDELTQVYNKRYINEKLPVDILESVSNDTPISFIMIDIDYFKQINDDYGHIAGDNILKEFGSILLDSIRDNKDWVGRYGGDEFLIVLNNTTLEEALKVGERIRGNVAKTVFSGDNNEVKLTASIGVYSSKGKQVTIEEIIREVDKSLYRAKKEGRNKVIGNEREEL